MQRKEGVKREKRRENLKILEVRALRLDMFPGAVRLTAVIHRDRPEWTSLAENHRESDRWKTSG